MAAGRLPLPGSKFGPCLDGCDHIYCNRTRTMAETICHYCEKAIGYDRGFYMLDEKKLVHSSCHEDAIAAEGDVVAKKKSDLDFINTSVDDLQSTLHCAEVNKDSIFNSAILQKAFKATTRRGEKTKARLIQRYIQKAIKKERMA